MKRFALLALLGFALSAQAQDQPAATANPAGSPQRPVGPPPHPDSVSPFFFEEESEALDQNLQQSLANRPISQQYPMGRGSTQTFSAQVGGFFKEMFSSVNLGPIRGEPTGGRIQVEPQAFSLTDRRELAVTYSVVNNSNKIIRLEYPTTQRIEIATKAPDGTTVERWSDDRAFEPEEGIVIINPKERIEYQETVPTREMKPGSTYNIEVNTTSQDAFTVSKPVTPSE